MGRIAVPLVTRFWRQVRRAGPDECWTWLGHPDGRGYGQVRGDGCHASKRLAHRVSWEIANGEIPPGLWVLHRCDNPPCVNPAHLFLGTRKDNIDDMMSKRRNRQPRGVEHRGAKLTDDTAREIRMLWRLGASAIALGERFGISDRTVTCIGRGIGWKHVGGFSVHESASS